MKKLILILIVFFFVLNSFAADNKDETNTLKTPEKKGVEEKFKNE